METFEIRKSEIVQLYDRLSVILTDWEQGCGSEYEMYDFMVALHRELAEIIN